MWGGFLLVALLYVGRASGSLLRWIRPSGPRLPTVVVWEVLGAGACWFEMAIRLCYPMWLPVSSRVLYAGDRHRPKGTLVNAQPGDNDEF